MTAFPEAAWFESLGHLMKEQREVFERLGYAETRCVLKVIGEGNGQADRYVGLAFEGYGLAGVKKVASPEEFDPDFILCARAFVWERMLEEIRENGHPSLRRTLSSLVLVGDEMWLESEDQLREDRFYRFNQTLQEFFNLAASSAGAG